MKTLRLALLIISFLLISLALFLSSFNNIQSHKHLEYVKVVDGHLIAMISSIKANNNAINDRNLSKLKQEWAEAGDYAEAAFDGPSGIEECIQPECRKAYRLSKVQWEQFRQIAIKANKKPGINLNELFKKGR